jgi:hypothetical protein
MRATLAAVLCVCGLASQASMATTLVSTSTVRSFDFYANGGSFLDTTSSVPSFTVGDLSVTLKAFVSGKQGLVDLRWDGIGVTNDSWFNEGAITANESLQLTFSKAVSLKSLGLSSWDLLDTATLSWGAQSIKLNGGLLSAVDGYCLDNVVGTTFTLTGTGLLTHFRLAGIQAQAVPEPSTWALLGLGLLGVAAKRQRRMAPHA